MSSHVVVLDGVDKIKSNSNPQVELVVDDTVNDINDLQANKLDATAKAVDSDKLDGLDSTQFLRSTANAVSASKWATARTISLGGDATGSVSIDGTANKTLTVAVANDSHTHDSRYYTETEINTKLTNLEADIKNDLLGGAGAAYDTLKELETALTSNDSEIAALTTTIGTKLGKTEKAADSNKLDGLDSTQFLRSDASDVQTSGSLTIGTGSASGSKLIIKASDDNVSDHIQFYNGTTRVGEIGVEDDWLRINQETAKNIYTPRMIRADGGFQVDGKWVVSADGNNLYENGTALSAKYLGKTSKAADSDKLDGLDSSVFARTANVPPKPSTTTPASQALAWNGSAFINVSAGKTPSAASQTGEYLQWDGSNFVNKAFSQTFSTEVTDLVNEFPYSRTFAAPTVGTGTTIKGKYINNEWPSYYKIAYGSMSGTFDISDLANYLDGYMNLPNYPFAVTLEVAAYVQQADWTSGPFLRNKGVSKSFGDFTLRINEPADLDLLISGSDSKGNNPLWHSVKVKAIHTAVESELPEQPRYSNHLTFATPTVDASGAYSDGKYLDHFERTADGRATYTIETTAANLATFLNGTMAVPNYPFQVTMKAYILGHATYPYFQHILPDGNILTIMNWTYINSGHSNYATLNSLYQYGNKVYPNYASTSWGGWSQPFTVEINDPSEFNFKSVVRDDVNYTTTVGTKLQLISISYN